MERRGQHRGDGIGILVFTQNSNYNPNNRNTQNMNMPPQPEDGNPFTGMSFQYLKFEYEKRQRLIDKLERRFDRVENERVAAMSRAVRQGLRVPLSQITDSYVRESDVIVEELRPIRCELALIDKAMRYAS